MTLHDTTDDEYSDELSDQITENNEIIGSRVGDYVLVHYAKKKSIVHYVGLFTKKVENEVEIKYYRRKPDSYKFYLPDKKYCMVTYI